MEEEELLEWIDRQMEAKGVRMFKISHLSALMPPTLNEKREFAELDGDVAILKDLKRVVINWYQGRKAIKEG